LRSSRVIPATRATSDRNPHLHREVTPHLSSVYNDDKWYSNMHGSVIRRLQRCMEMTESRHLEWICGLFPFVPFSSSKTVNLATLVFVQSPNPFFFYCFVCYSHRLHVLLLSTSPTLVISTPKNQNHGRDQQERVLDHGRKRSVFIPGKCS
jgi:hypothetical protein